MNQQQIKVSLKDTKEVKCSQCGNTTFNPCYLMREVNQFVIGAKQKTLSPIEVFECLKCHHVLEDTMPMELKENPKPNILK